MNTDFEQIIQWYPGHMAAAMRKIDEYMKLIDIVIEVVDARVPRCGSNPMLDQIMGKRPRLIVLSREDLADPVTTVKWLTTYNTSQRRAVAVNGKDQTSVGKANFHLGQLLSTSRVNQRAIVVGLPNAGKSSIINGLLRRSVAKTEDRPGVTRGTQWFRVQPMLELMDTPGVLVPKIETPEAQWMLAITGAIPKDHYDPEDVADRFHKWLVEKTEKRTRVPDLQTFANARGFLRRGNTIDMHNAAQSYIKDFNDGKFGRITFEEPPQRNDGKAAQG
ncbi:MAG: ribosome biogenesis GTPase YlqF [Candidatus Eremiobacteraeota bacterium]|nr:ribosome biogenesis GTPase YlqF [Candidatus Eremiobacteraeota bacterium]